MERNDSNTKAYRDFMDDYPGEVNARMLLSGALEPPPWAQGLISAIERHSGTLFDATWVDDQPSDHEERRNRGYSFGSEFAAQSSTNSPTSKLKKSQRGSSHNTRADEDEYGDRYDEDRARSPPDSQGITSSRDRMAVMANQYKGRLRGYSLGSFGKKNNSSGGSVSGSSTPTRKNARDRSHSTATPRTRYDDYGHGDYIDDDYNDYRTSGPQYTRRRGFSDAQDDAPPVSPGGSSLASKGAKFTEFMKRPVMPARKSTSSVQTMSKSTKENSSSTSSRWKPGSHTKKEKNRLQYSGKYDSDEGRYGRDNLGAARDTRNDGRRKNTSGIDSPFGDQFNQVEHRFSSEHEDEDGVYGYRDSSAAARDKKSDSKASRFMSGLSRPANTRSSTAPVQSGAYRPYHDDDASDGEDGYDGVIQYTGNGRGQDRNGPARSSVYAFSERFDENTARQSFDSLDQQAPIAIFKHTVESENPFDESTSATIPQRIGKNNGEGQFFSHQESKDLLSTLDEELPLSSSYSDVERPTHRLDSRQFNRNNGNKNGNYHTEDYDDDNESIRSIDSSKEYMVVGQKAHKIPLKVRQVDNDLMTSPTEMYQTDTAKPSGKKEWRVATFDFEGGQVSLDR